MRHVLILSLLIYCGNSAHLAAIEDPLDPELRTCFTNIMEKYFVPVKKITYVTFNDTYDILHHIFSMGQLSVCLKMPPYLGPSWQTPGYVVTIKDVSEFVKLFHLINEDLSWNPLSIFLVIIYTIKWYELRQIFDVFLSLRIINVVVLNGTRSAELYTYNPYANYGCGRYYSTITEFGQCFNVTEDIYPEKITTGFRNCLFRVSVPHWPPYGLNPAKIKDGIDPIGTDQYILGLMSEVLNFKYEFYFDYNAENFSTVHQNLSVSGPLLLLLNNQTDIMLGGLVLTASRARKFCFLSGYLDNVDEVRIMVKKAEETPCWQDFYLGFSPIIWGLLLLALVIYSVLMAILLKPNDKVHVLMILIDNLLSHGSTFQCRQSVKCVFLVWVVFSYLSSSFYTTNLMSLTTKPLKEPQIADEETALKMNLEPCICEMMNKYRKAEINYPKLLKDIEIGIKGCEQFVESIHTVTKSKRMFTTVLYSVYLFHKMKFYDDYGHPMAYSFKKPYTKVIYAMLFNKGFPLNERLHMIALRIRETGLAERNLNSHFYNQQIKYFRFHHLDFKARFAIPWYIYVIGLSFAIITLGLERTYHSKKIAKLVGGRK